MPVREWHGEGGIACRTIKLVREGIDTYVPKRFGERATEYLLVTVIKSA
jgi:hypothetical protein